MFNENGVVFSEKFLKGEGGMCFAAVLAFLVYSFERETVNYFRIFRGNKKISNRNLLYISHSYWV